MHVHPLLMVACLMRLSPLERGRKEGRTCAAIKSLAWAAASVPFVATLKIQPTKKNRIIHRFGFRQSNLPSVLFLAMCNLPLERNNQRRQGRLSSFPPFAQSKFDRRPTDDWRRFSVRAFTVRRMAEVCVGFARITPQLNLPYNDGPFLVGTWEVRNVVRKHSST